MKHIAFSILLSVTLSVITGCEKSHSEGENCPGSKLVIINEGSFGAGNSSISVYNPEKDEISNNVYQGTNGSPLGNLAQSVSIHGNSSYIVMNGDGCVVRVNSGDFKETGRITGLSSPRYIHIVSDSKAYISQLENSDIIIADPSSLEITGRIPTGAQSTEQFVEYGRYVYVGCWSFGNTILKINTETDEIEDKLVIGEQPNSMAIDKKGKLWVITDGGWTPDFSEKLERPALHVIDLETFKEEKEYEFGEWDSVSDLTIDKDSSTLYFLNSGVYRMSIDASSLPQSPIISAEPENSFYSLSISPDGSEIYVGDAKDYSSDGSLLIYSSDGRPVSDFKTGINPGFMVWAD